jgi:predicted membrane-bound spermidine synthase
MIGIEAYYGNLKSAVITKIGQHSIKDYGVTVVQTDNAGWVHLTVGRFDDIGSNPNIVSLSRQNLDDLIVALTYAQQTVYGGKK